MRARVKWRRGGKRSWFWFWDCDCGRTGYGEDYDVIAIKAHRHVRMNHR